MKYFKYILALFLLSNNITAQVLEGYVSDTSEIPLNAVSVYISEIKQGLISNKNGRFRISLEAGSYTLICKHPEYIESTQRVSISEGDSLHLTFTMKPASFSPYHSNPKTDTLAHQIISNSIKMSSVFHNAIQSYSADSYLNGRLTLKSIHPLVDKAGYKIDNFHLSEFENKIAIQEMHNSIEYLYPSRYKINVEASRGIIPENFTAKSILKTQSSSIYANKFGRFISPLSSSALTFYRFRYIGFYDSGGIKYHKIRIKPRKNDPELLNGYLYIEDGSWSVCYAKLKSNAQGMSMTADIAYNRIQGNIYLPISYYSDIDFTLPGVEGTVCYYATVRYNEISDKKITANSDKMLEEEIQKSGITTEQAASDRNDDYWTMRRMQPIENDSVGHIPDSIRYLKDKLNPTNHWIGKVLLGDYIIGRESDNFSLKYNGVKMIFRDYNYVDGFWLGNRFDIKVKINQKRSIEVYPYIYYVTGRNRILGGSDITYNYNQRKNNYFSFNFGSRSDDFNNLSLTRYQNYFASLFLGENYNFFYQRDFASINNSIHLNRKFKLTASFGVEKRSGLSNHTDFNLFNRDHIKPNMFSGDRFDRTYYSVGLLYSPKSNYSITEAMDMHIKNVTPVFNIEYQEGFSSWQTHNSKYQKLKGGVSHNIQLDYFNSIDYKIEAGVFLKKDRSMHFADYQHFGASDLLLNLNSLSDSFVLLDNYELHTNRYWGNLFLNYSGRYVFFKHIPILQRKPFSENLHLKVLFTPDIKSYVETGYSISFNRYFGFGIFTSFHNIKIKKFGVKFSLNLRSLNFD